VHRGGAFDFKVTGHYNLVYRQRHYEISRIRNVPQKEYKIKKTNRLKMSKRGNSIFYYVNDYLVHLESLDEYSNYYNMYKNLGFVSYAGTVEIDNFKVTTLPKIDTDGTNTDSIQIRWNEPLSEYNVVMTGKNKFIVSVTIKNPYDKVYLIQNGNVIETAKVYARQEKGQSCTIVKEIALELGRNRIEVISTYEGQKRKVHSSKSSQVDIDYESETAPKFAGLGMDFIGYGNPYVDELKYGQSYGAKDLLSFNENWYKNLGVYFQIKGKKGIHSVGYQKFDSLDLVTYAPRYPFFSLIDRKSSEINGPAIVNPVLRAGMFTHEEYRRGSQIYSQSPILQVGFTTFHVTGRGNNFEILFNGLTFYYNLYTPPQVNLGRGALEVATIRIFYLF